MTRVKLIMDKHTIKDVSYTKLARWQRRGSSQWWNRWGIITEQGWKEKASKDRFKISRRARA
jgi:hypothetical protein